MMKRAAVVLAVAFLPAALFQRRRPNRGAWGRRCLVGGACFCWAASLWSCFAVRAALTPGCRSRHARQRPLRRLPGRACLPVSGALLFLAPSMAFACEMRASPHDARCESGAPDSLRLVEGIGCVRRRIKSLGFQGSRCRAQRPFARSAVGRRARNRSSSTPRNQYFVRRKQLC